VDSLYAKVGASQKRSMVVVDTSYGTVGEDSIAYDCRALRILFFLLHLAVCESLLGSPMSASYCWIAPGIPWTNP